MLPLMLDTMVFICPMFWIANKSIGLVIVPFSICHYLLLMMFSCFRIFVTDKLLSLYILQAFMLKFLLLYDYTKTHITSVFETKINVTLWWHLKKKDIFNESYCREGEKNTRTKTKMKIYNQTNSCKEGNKTTTFSCLKWDKSVEAFIQYRNREIPRWILRTIICVWTLINGRHVCCLHRYYLYELKLCKTRLLSAQVFV